MTLTLLLLWIMLVVLTIGPIFSAQKNEQDSSWTWILAAAVFGPLAGVGYYFSRYAMRKAAERNGKAVPASRR